MDTLAGYIATVVVSLLVGYLAQFLQPRSRLVWWSPHNFLFNLKSEGVVLQTNSLNIQNIGRLPAEDVEIIHKQRPDFFELFPAMQFEEGNNPNGEHVIRIKSLGPKEWVMVQLLSHKTPPVFSNVRWKHGQAKWVQIQPQRVFPKWVLAAMNAFALIGVGTIVYLVGRFGVYVLQVAERAGA
jgi:hypothetical protein